MPHFLDYLSAYRQDKLNKNNKIKITAVSVVAIMTESKQQFHNMPDYGSIWRWKHWSVQQIKPAQLAFGRTLI